MKFPSGRHLILFSFFTALLSFGVLYIVTIFQSNHDRFYTEISLNSGDDRNWVDLMYNNNIIDTQAQRDPSVFKNNIDFVLEFDDTASLLNQNGFFERKIKIIRGKDGVSLQIRHNDNNTVGQIIVPMLKQAREIYFSEILAAYERHKVTDEPPPFDFMKFDAVRSIYSSDFIARIKTTPKKSLSFPLSAFLAVIASAFVAQSGLWLFKHRLRVLKLLASQFSDRDERLPMQS